MASNKRKIVVFNFVLLDLKFLELPVRAVTACVVG